MSKINVDTWEPESGTAATLMASGDTVTVPSGAELDIASGATLDVNGTIDVTGATTTGFPAGGMAGVQVYTAGGTWTKATRESALGVTITKVIVEVQGAGGSGAATGSGYGGGGGGGYSKKIVDVSSVTASTITIGTGGAAVGANAGAGAAGGVSFRARLSESRCCGQWWSG